MLTVREYLTSDGRIPFREWLDFGPGFRIYFGNDGRSIVVLLVGGSKASQTKDIRRAQSFWQDYLEAKRHGPPQ
jgi:putative addiction module killer protein